MLTNSCHLLKKGAFYLIKNYKVNFPAKCLPRYVFLGHFNRTIFLGIMPHCIFEDTLDCSNVEKFDGANWEHEIKAKTHIKQLSKVPQK